MAWYLLECSEFVKLHDDWRVRDALYYSFHGEFQEPRTPPRSDAGADEFEPPELHRLADYIPGIFFPMYLRWSAVVSEPVAEILEGFGVPLERTRIGGLYWGVGRRVNDITLEYLRELGCPEPDCYHTMLRRVRRKRRVDTNTVLYHLKNSSTEFHDLFPDVLAEIRKKGVTDARSKVELLKSKYRCEVLHEFPFRSALMGGMIARDDLFEAIRPHINQRFILCEHFRVRGE